MKRDWNLIRRILLDVRDNSDASGAYQDPPAPEGWDTEVVLAHVEMLIEAGYLEGMVRRSNDGIAAAVSRLTWEGHDFVEAMADDTTWKKALVFLREKGAAQAADVVFALLKDWAMRAAGLS
jgi:hypothetical protein